MIPPTRLERLVEQANGYSVRNHDLYDRGTLEAGDTVFHEVEVLMLLRREQARVRRIVKAQPKAKGYVEDLIRRDDLLAALNGKVR